MGGLLFRPAELRLRRSLVECTSADLKHVLKDNASNDEISWLIILVMNKLGIPHPTLNHLGITNCVWQQHHNEQDEYHHLECQPDL